MSRSTDRSRFFSLLLAAVLLSAPSLLLAQDDQPTNAGFPARHAEGLTGSFNATTSPYHFLYVTNPVIGTSVSGCTFFNVIVHNSGAEAQQFLAELWRTPNTSGASASVLVTTSGHTPIAGDTRQFVFNSYTVGPTGCSTVGGFFLLKVYSTSASLAVSAYYNTGVEDSAYPGTAPFLFHIPTGAFLRSVMTSSFSFGSSAGVCATAPENSIKVPASKAFPGSPVFGDYGWQTSGGSNSDTCSGAAYADFFIRSSANISGAGKWTFTYQVPNGFYDVAVIYNASPTTAGDTTITVNGQTVANAVTTPGGANVQQANVRLNVGGNQILVGVSSATGTAVLNGVIVTPVAQ